MVFEAWILMSGVLVIVLVSWMTRERGPTPLKRR
jgi:hypothetical protein